MSKKIKKARVFTKQDKNEQWHMVLAGGVKGRGKELYSCIFWMDEGGNSESMAKNYCIDKALVFGIDRLYEEIGEDQDDHILDRQGDIFVDSPDSPYN